MSDFIHTRREPRHQRNLGIRFLISRVEDGKVRIIESDGSLIEESTSGARLSTTTRVQHTDLILIGFGGTEETSSYSPYNVVWTRSEEDVNVLGCRTAPAMAFQSPPGPEETPSQKNMPCEREFDFHCMRHDLNNHLSTISMAIDLAMMHIDPGHKALEFLNNASHGFSGINTVMNKLAIASRLFGLSPVPSFITCLDDGMISLMNSSLQALIGTQGGSHMSIGDLMDADALARLMDTLKRSGYVGGYPIKMKNSKGDEIPCALFAERIATDSNRHYVLVQAVNLGASVSSGSPAAERAEDGTDESISSEMHHRIKNSLAILQAVLKQQAGRTTDPAAAASLRDAANRLYSVSQAHDHLSGRTDTSNARIYLREVAALAIDSNSHGPARPCLSIDMADLPLDHGDAVACGMILNELITNALKHSGADRIMVRLETEPGGSTLMVSDNGRGLPEGFDIANAESLGLNIVATMVRKLSGKIRFTSSQGTEVSVKFPSGTKQ